MAGAPVHIGSMLKDRLDWQRVSTHEPSESGFESIGDFAKSYSPSGGHAFSKPKEKLIWVDGWIEEKKSLDFRYCTEGKDCKATLCFRPMLEDGNVMWLVESVGEHVHEERSKSFFQNLAFEYATTKNLTADRAIVEIGKKSSDLELPPGFRKSMENIRHYRSTSGRIDGRVRGVLQAFLLALPAGLFTLNAVLEPIAIPFFFYGLDAVVASTMQSFSSPLNLIIDGTYRMNRQNLVLLAVCISGLRLVGSSIVNQLLPIFFMVARVEENESWDLLFRTASEYYLSDLELILPRVSELFSGIAPLALVLLSRSGSARLASLSGISST
jgi:hypothetical protein